MQIPMLLLVIGELKDYEKERDILFKNISTKRNLQVKVLGLDRIVAEFPQTLDETENHTYPVFKNLEN